MRNTTMRSGLPTHIVNASLETTQEFRMDRRVLSDADLKADLEAIGNGDRKSRRVNVR